MITKKQLEHMRVQLYKAKKHIQSKEFCNGIDCENCPLDDKVCFRPDDVLFEQLILINKRLSEIKTVTINNMYYNHKENFFSQVRMIIDEKHVRVSYAEYYGDARTTISTIDISLSVFQRDYVPVRDVTDFAEYDGVGWKVKEK